MRNSGKPARPFSPAGDNLFSPRGFSFIEMMVASVVLVLIGGSVSTLMFQGQRSYQSQRGMIEVAQQGRIGMEQIISFVRQAGNDPEETGITPIQILGANHIRINSDLTGLEGGLGDPDGDIDDLYEQVVVRHDTTAPGYVKIDLADGNGERILIENIPSGDFVISPLNASGSVTATEADIRAVRVEMKVRTAQEDLQTGNIQSITLRSEAYLRSQSYAPF